jgi:hypothetical protein
VVWARSLRLSLNKNHTQAGGRSLRKQIAPASYGNTLEVAVTRYENFVSIEGEIPLKIGALKWQEPYQNQATQAQRVLQFQ